ncbi:MAG: HNH endonuclease [Lachnospiraceae bacterium]|nr:HNH endonuclease [Lachnospiraceae bacterium]MDD7027517.1 HNH endonuclease [Lachnospiraceae bacterium]
MRPIDKGDSPYTTIRKYQDAEPYLEEKIGRYCSFCEMRVNSALAVEHKESKNSGGALTDWSNLLLGCIYCNSRKGEKIKKGELNKWIWPDQDNTFLAFSYSDALPKLNELYLKSISNEVYLRAKTIFEDLALDYRPVNLNRDKYRDKRWQTRYEVLGVAKEAKSIWERCHDNEKRMFQKKNIVAMAKGYGFFSVWMMVFEKEPDIRQALIQAFPGTSLSCFDEEGNAKRRCKGYL